VSTRWIERRRTCLAYSAGGHLAELERATRGIVFEDCFHVTYAGGRAPERPGPVHHVLHPRRTVWRTLVNAAQALLILLRHRPRLIISTGADVAVPILVLGKLVGARIVFIETGGSLEPTLAGRLVYPIADLFLVQWSEKLRAFPRATLSRGLLL
jgi:hypothetical protein